MGITVEMISRFHEYPLEEEMLNGNPKDWGNPLWASQVTIGKMAEIGKGTSRQGAKKAAARKLF